MSEQIPKRIKDAIDNHVTKGQGCGFFVTSVLENKLAETLGHADPECMEQLRSIVGYCYNKIPSPCWGSSKKVKAWRKKGGDKKRLENAS